MLSAESHVHYSTFPEVYEGDEYCFSMVFACDVPVGQVHNSDFPLFRTKHIFEWKVVCTFSHGGT